MNPPLQKPFDIQKYREQYLSYLRLEASNNQKISNAVMLLKTTGQLPMPPLDVRTTTEKLQDLEGNKVQLRALLQEVTDGGIAGQIMSSLDSDQITFAIQNWETIKRDMNRKYGRGVPLNVFIVYLNKLIDDTQKAEGVQFGLQLATGNNILLSKNQLYLPAREDILKELSRLLVQANASVGVDINKARQVIQDNISTNPRLDDFTKIEQMPEDNKNNVYKILDEAYGDIMPLEELLQLTQSLDKNIRAKDKQSVTGDINTIVNKLNIDEQKKKLIADLRYIIARGGDIELLALPFPEEQMAKPSRTKKEIPREVRESMEGMLTQMEIQNALEAGLPTSSIGKPIKTRKPKGPKSPKKFPPETVFEEDFPKDLEWDNLLLKKQKVDYLNARLAGSPELVLTADEKSYGMNVNGKRKKIPASTTGTKVLNKLYDDYITKSQNKTIGNGLKSKMKGKGLVEKPYRQSIAHLIDTSELE